MPRRESIKSSALRQEARIAFVQESSYSIGILLQITKEITGLKRKVITDTQSQELAIRQDRKMYILESRVEAATKRFNLMVASNTKLRNEIETILKEREQFTQQWNKLLGHLKTGKQIFNDLIEQATITFNQREEELQKIQALRERWIHQLSASTIAPLVKSRDLRDRGSHSGT